MPINIFVHYSQLHWRKWEIWEVTSQWVTVESGNTESRQVVEESPVVCITKESWWTNSKYLRSVWLIVFLSQYSHPGFYGKLGIRVFHKQNNRYFCPTINTDKLWSLVSEATRNSAAKSKDMAPVIDVTHSVSRVFLTKPLFSTFLFFNWFIIDDNLI